MEIWSKEECVYLKQMYGLLDKHTLTSVLNRSWPSIQNKAFLLKIKRETNANSRKLISETNESYYWLGFLMADGHFNKNGQIQINLAEKDLKHLQKLGEFLEYKRKITKPHLSFSFTEIKEELESKFNVVNNKTYNPCNLQNISGDALFSFIIGFIDGDGSISKRGCLSIISHKNWLENICLMIKEISNDKYCSCKINKVGFSYATITNIETLKLIKRKIISLGLPVLQRKWERISFDKLSKNERFLNNSKIIEELTQQGLSTTEIIKKTGLSKSNIYKHKKTLRIR